MKLSNILIGFLVALAALLTIKFGPVFFGGWCLAWVTCVAFLAKWAE
jgi:hypothetical protein